MWTEVSDLGSHGEWIADAESIEFLTEQRKGVGTRLAVVTRVGPLPTKDLIEVVHWEPPNLIGVRHLGVITGSGEFRLSPVAGGTRFIWTEELSFPWKWGGPVGGVVAGLVLRTIWRRNLRRFQQRLEGR